jgi:hypothetical protein
MLKFWTIAVVVAFISTSAIAAPASRVVNYSSMVTKCGDGCGNGRCECETSDQQLRRALNCR